MVPMSLLCPCVGGSLADRAGNLVLFSVVRPLGRVTNNEPLPVLRQRLGGHLDSHRYVRAVAPGIARHRVGRCCAQESTNPGHQ
jgi:hypothetical protein